MSFRSRNVHQTEMKVAFRDNMKISTSYCTLYFLFVLTFYFRHVMMSAYQGLALRLSIRRKVP